MLRILLTASVLMGWITLAYADDETHDSVGRYVIETMPKFGFLILLDTKTGRSWISSNRLGSVDSGLKVIWLPNSFQGYTEASGFTPLHDLPPPPRPSVTTQGTSD